MNSSLRAALTLLSSDPCKAHVGVHAGDARAVQLSELPKDNHAIVSGPPCPPWSSIGKRLSINDRRASVFTAVCAWIVFLATEGRLLFFVLENVRGITHKRKHDAQSFAQWVIDGFLAVLPSKWSVRVVHRNAALCSVAQSRPRVFFVGTSRAMQSSRRFQR